MNQQKNNKKEIFSILIDYMYLNDTNKQIVDVNISSFDNSFLIDEIKSLKIIELDSLERFVFYLNFDHFLIFKFNDDYYFCCTELTPALGVYSMIRIMDYNLYFRKDKLKNINLKSI